MKYIQALEPLVTDMDFDGFLIQMRIEIDGIERTAAPLWEIAERAQATDTAGSVPSTEPGASD